MQPQADNGNDENVPYQIWAMRLLLSAMRPFSISYASHHSSRIHRALPISASVPEDLR